MSPTTWSRSRSSSARRELVGRTSTGPARPDHRRGDAHRKRWTRVQARVDIRVGEVGGYSRNRAAATPQKTRRSRKSKSQLSAIRYRVATIAETSKSSLRAAPVDSSSVTTYLVAVSDVNTNSPSVRAHTLGCGTAAGPDAPRPPHRPLPATDLRVGYSRDIRGLISYLYIAQNRQNRAAKSRSPEGCETARQSSIPGMTACARRSVRTATPRRAPAARTRRTPPRVQWH
jgi:hypothetical protein